jgi:hypothetical protein
MASILWLALLILLILRAISRWPRRLNRPAGRSGDSLGQATRAPAPVSGYFQGPPKSMYWSWLLIPAAIPLLLMSAVLVELSVVDRTLAEGGKQIAATGAIAGAAVPVLLVISVLGPAIAWLRIRNAAHSVRWDPEGLTVTKYSGRAYRFERKDLDRVYALDLTLGLRGYRALMVSDRSGRTFTVLGSARSPSPGFSALTTALEVDAAAREDQRG